MGFWDGSGISWTICKQYPSRSRQQLNTAHQHLITRLLEAGCSSWRQTDSVKALKELENENNGQDYPTDKADAFLGLIDTKAL